jgi:hypothetical protein
VYIIHINKINIKHKNHVTKLGTLLGDFIQKPKPPYHLIDGGGE